MSARSHGALWVGVLLVLGVEGCGGTGDEAFRRAVPAVLSEAAGLDSAITQAIPPTPKDRWAPTPYAVEAEGRRARGVADDYWLHVSQLPKAHSQHCRYLRSRLVDLGRAARVLVEAEERSHSTMTMWGQPAGKLMDFLRRMNDQGRLEGVARARFLEAFLLATAAERATLGTETLPDSHAPEFATADSLAGGAGWTKGTVAAKARLVECELRETP